MSFIEFIGFIIVMLALFFLSIKRAREEKYRREHPEEFEQEEKAQQEALREFLKTLDIEVEEEVGGAPPPPPPSEEKVEEEIPEPVMEERGEIFEKPHVEVYAHKKMGASRARDIIKEGSLKDAVILHEVLGPPKALK